MMRFLLRFSGLYHKPCHDAKDSGDCKGEQADAESPGTAPSGLIISRNILAKSCSTGSEATSKQAQKIRVKNCACFDHSGRENSHTIPILDGGVHARKAHVTLLPRRQSLGRL